MQHLFFGRSILFSRNLWNTWIIETYSGCAGEFIFRKHSNQVPLQGWVWKSYEIMSILVPISPAESNIWPLSKCKRRFWQSRRTFWISIFDQFLRRKNDKNITTKNPTKLNVPLLFRIEYWNGPRPEGCIGLQQIVLPALDRSCAIQRTDSIFFGLQSLARSQMAHRQFKDPVCSRPPAAGCHVRVPVSSWAYYSVGQWQIPGQDLQLGCLCLQPSSGCVSWWSHRWR